MARGLGRALYRVNAMFWGVVVLILLGILMVISIPLQLLYHPLRKVLGAPHVEADPEALDIYEHAVRAMRIGDIPTLERMSDTVPSFPAGNDRFLGRPWIFSAVDSGRLDALRWVIEKGGNVNAMDEEGRSPLTAAIARADGSEEAVQLLIDSGADVNAVAARGETALHHAAERGSPEVVRILLENGADPRITDGNDASLRALDVAERWKRDEVATILRAHMEAADQV